MLSKCRIFIELYLFVILLGADISKSYGFIIKSMNGAALDRRYHLHTVSSSSQDENDFVDSDSPNKNGDSLFDDPPKYRSDLRQLFNIKRSSFQNKPGNEEETYNGEKNDHFQRENEQLYSQLDQTSWDFTESDYAIDSFLRGEYDRPFAEDAAAPTPDYSPSQTVEIAFENLRRLNEPDISHGSAVFMRFCCPLTRNDRWGGSSSSLSHWKQIIRGALTPTMLARRIRSSQEFSALLDWTRLDTTDGMSVPESRLGMESSVAFVNAALYLGTGISPTILQVKLQKLSGVWLIDNISNCQEDLFTSTSNDSL